MQKFLLVLALLIGLIWARELYLPLFLRPEHDFLYATGPSYSVWNHYTVEAGTLSEQEVASPNTEPSSDGSVEEVRLFVYDVQKDVSRAISLQEAQRLALVRTGHDLQSIALSKPSNGFQVSFGVKGDCGWTGIICDVRDYDNVWLEGRSMSRRLNIDVSLEEDRSFHFLGWISRKPDTAGISGQHLGSTPWPSSKAYPRWVARWSQS